tara:strand:+ start:2070 stop:7607 length:5538 start_codon:yes stop_codon:yes gene_type:complete
MPQDDNLNNLGINPDTASELQGILDSIRSKGEGPRYNYLGQKNSGPILVDNEQGFESVEYSVDKNAIYDRLSDGSYTPKYDNYIGATGNEDRFAAEQGTFEKIIKGLTKNVIKVGAYATDAIVGTAYGIYSGISKGSWDAVWNNEVSNSIDDFNKKLDNNLANYYSEEEKSMSVLRSMGTANFWFNDVAGGFAFVAGALLPELAIGAITGGATAGVGLARASFKRGIKEFGEQSIKAGARETVEQVGKKSMFSNVLSKIPGYNTYRKGAVALRTAERNVLGKTTGDIFGTATFLARTSNFEAGMEARHNFHTSVENYYRDFEDLNGRSPSLQDSKDFLKLAKSSANGVYAANLAILTVSNAVMFSNKFNVGVKTSKALKNSVNKAFGLGTVVKKGGKRAMQVATKKQKLLGNAYLILSRPAVEGLYEEGFQGVAGTTMQNYLQSKYNPKTETTYDHWASLTDAFAHQYSSREGWKEMAIGMIIGSMGGSIQGGPIFAGIGKKSSRKGRASQIESQVERANKGVDNLVAKMNKSNALNDLSSVIDEKDGEYESTFVENKMLAQEYIATQEAVKSQKEIIEDYDAIVDNMELENSDLGTSDYQSGIQKDNYKSSLKEEFRSNLATYNSAKKLVSDLGLEDGRRKGFVKDSNGNKVEIEDYLIKSMMLGENALYGAKNTADIIGNLIGVDGAFSVLEFFNNSTTEQKAKIKELRAKAKDVEELKEEALNFRNKIEGLPSKGAGNYAESTKQKRYKDATEKFNLAQQRIVVLEKEIEKLAESISSSKKAQGFDVNRVNSTTASPQDILDSIEEFDKLDGFITALEREGRQQEADQLKYLIEDYKMHSDAHREMNNTYNLMLDTDFFASTKGKGLKDSIVGKKYAMSPEFKQILKDNNEIIDKSLRQFGYRDIASVEELIKARIEDNDELSDREKFRMEALIRLELGYKKVEEEISDAQKAANEEFIESNKVTSTNPLEGDTIQLKSKLNAKGKDLGNISVLDNLIKKITDALDDFRLGKIDKANADKLKAKLVGLKAKRDAIDEEAILADIKSLREAVRVAEKKEALKPAEQTSEAEAKIAEIERKRKEDLSKGVETRVGRGEFEYSELTPEGGLGFIAMGAATMRDQIVKKLDGKERLSAQKFMSMLFEMGKSLEEVADRLEKKYKIRVSGGKYQIQETEYNKINAKYDKLVALEKQAELAALGTKTDETESQPTITSKALKQKIEDKKLELPNTIDKEIIAVSEELKEVEGKKAYKIIGSPEYKRLYELNTKRANKEITTEELEELRELEDDIDQWMMITGSVAEGIRLSDLIRQKAILETAVISPIENVVTPTEEQLIESSDTGENSKSANYSFSQSYDGVTIMINNDGQTEISGITWQKFIALAGIPISTVQVKKKAGEDTIFEPFTVNDRGNIVLTAELVEEINEIGNLTIGATNQDLITSFSMVLHTNESTNDETKTETTVLKSDFLFETPMDTDAIYGMKENDEIALEIDPKDPWNKKLIGAYRKAIKSKAKGKAKEKAIDKAIKDMRDSLLIRVRKTTGEREFVAVLKSKRKRVKDAETAAKFEALRDQIVSENLESLLDGNSRTLKGFEITVDTILVGHPNFNYKKNEDNKIVVETKALTENDIDKIEDTGYLDENGPHTRSGKKGLDIRLLRKAQRDNDKGAKIPFVVISKGNTRIAIPVVIDPNESDSSLDKFEEIYNSKSEAIDRASALNIFMAERGLDIKLQGNSFIVAGEASNINDNTFFTNKLAQLEEINYFRDLETWAKKDISKEEVLRDGVSSKINLDNPIHSPKLKLNFKNMDIEISEEFVPDVESVNRNTSKNGPKKFNERLRKNEKKEC